MTLMSSELAAADCSSARVTESSGGERGSRTPGESYIIETLTTFSSLLLHSLVVEVLLVFTMSQVTLLRTVSLAKHRTIGQYSFRSLRETEDFGIKTSQA